MLVAAFATEVAHTLQAPKVRATISDTRRLDWEEHMDDLENRKVFLPYYRMPEETFDKLLAPHLEKNAHMARECEVFKKNLNASPLSIHLSQVGKCLKV